MRSQKCGAVAYIQKYAKNAIWAPCFNHDFNLSLTKSANVMAIKNCFGTISETTNFLNSSAKRNFVVKKYVTKALSTLCQTRWVERHEVIKTFCLELENIGRVLEKLKNWHEPKVRSQANIFFKIN